MHVTKYALLHVVTPSSPDCLQPASALREADQTKKQEANYQRTVALLRKDSGKSCESAAARVMELLKKR